MKRILALILVLVLAVSAEALPSKYDLRELGRISEIKHQGIPGPCWAFAAIGAMESNYMTQKLNKDGKEPDLSELQLAFYCYRDPKPERNFTSTHNSGTLRLEGNPFMAVAFLSRLSGPTDEKNLKYSTSLTDSEKKALAKKSPESYKRTMRLRDAYFMNGHKAPDINTLKQIIMNHGAVSVSMYSELLKFRIRTNGKYFTYHNPNHGTETDHEVLLAGWDDDFPRSKFSPEASENGAWLVKNSWGSVMGTNGGYFWMPYEQFIKGGTAFIVEKASTRTRHYGYDDLGYCSNAKYSWAANVFKVQGTKETLNEAAFYTPEDNTEYELYVYSLGYNKPDNPTAGELVASTEGIISLVGYHTIDLPEQVSLNSDEYFSVVLRLSTNMPVETRISRYSENALVNERESYFSNDGQNWTDGINLKSNACIKAFTSVRID